MAKRGIKEWIIRSVILVIGLIIAHFGVTLFLLSNLGADPFNVFVQGLFRILSSVISGSEQPLWSRILMLVLGCVILAYGMTIVIKSDAGTGPNDLVAVVISDKTKKEIWNYQAPCRRCFCCNRFCLGRCAWGRNHYLHCAGGAGGRSFLTD